VTPGTTRGKIKDGPAVVARYERNALARHAKNHRGSQSPTVPTGIDADVHALYNGVWPGARDA